MRKKPMSLLRFTLGAAALIAACSLFTPYPAELARALRGTPASPDASSPRPIDIGEDNSGESDSRREVAGSSSEAHPPARRAPKAAPQTIPAGSVTRWLPQPPGSAPAVTLPPFPPVLPHRTASGSFENLSSLAKGLYLRSKVNFIPGTTAAADRKDKRSYIATFSLDIVLPQAAKGPELARFNPELPNVLNDFDALMEGAKVSPWYHSLYLRKQNEVRKNAANLSRLIDRHNFYDTDTILELKAPKDGRPLLWLQADMDVVSDGSDGDRLARMPEAIVKSDHYQPSTSYRWKKRGKTPNPLLSPWEARLAAAQTARKKATGAKKTACDERIDYAKRVIAELKNYSFLIAEYDPFIVLPLGIVNQKQAAYSPQFGDYALVIAGNKVFPAIVGDAGPRYKTGEASLRLAKAVNPKAGVYSRSVSDLSVSYLVFPGTAEPEKGPIDYDRLHARCRELLDSIGGLAPGAEFHEWDDQLKPAPAPTPDAPGAVPEKAATEQKPGSDQKPSSEPSTPGEKTTPLPPADPAKPSSPRQPAVAGERATGAVPPLPPLPDFSPEAR